MKRDGSSKRIKGARRGCFGFAGAEGGVAAVEFALVAPVFLVLMFATFEVAWFYFVNSQVDAAAVEAARFIRTGQAQKQNLDKGEFYAKVCGRLAALGNCADRLTVEVETFDSFAELAADGTAPVCSDDDTAEINALAYDPGLDNDIVRLRICVLYQTLNPALGINLSDRANGKRRVYGTFLSRNEPFTRGAQN